MTPDSVRERLKLIKRGNYTYRRKGIFVTVLQPDWDFLITQLERRAKALADAADSVLYAMTQHQVATKAKALRELMEGE